MEKVLLVGGGGHCASIIDSMNQQALYEPIGILDVFEKVGDTLLGVPIIGTDTDMQKYFNLGVKNIFISSGSIGDTRLRQKLQSQAEKIGFQFPNVIDPTAIVSKGATIKEGTFIGKGAIINTNVKIGAQVIVNSGVIIDHDSVIGDYVHLAPGATLSGGVTVGNRTHVGTNTTLIQGVTVGNDSLIGAGSVVLKDIGSHKKAYGNPCKEVEG